MKKKLILPMLLSVFAGNTVHAAPPAKTTKAAKTQKTKVNDKRLMQAIDEADVKTFEQELENAKVANTDQNVKALIGQAYLTMLNNKENAKLDRGEKAARTRRLNKMVNLLREKRATVLESA